jgi:hypothetical protein
MTTGLRIQRARPKDTMCGPALARPISDSTRSEKFLFCQTKPFTLLPAELPRAECPAAICDRHTPQASAASQIPQAATRYSSRVQIAHAVSMLPIPCRSSFAAIYMKSFPASARN